MASAARVKSEPGIKTEPGIKPDPEAAGGSPSALSEEDIYEDAGDLEFYDKNDPQTGYDNVYLTHLPPYLFDSWKQLDGKDEEIQIGTIRTWLEHYKLPDGTPATRNRLRLLIHTNSPGYQSLPKEYDLDVKDMALRDTFMFTEQDLPGYKNQAANSNLPPHLRGRNDRNRDKSQPDGGVGRKGRYQSWTKKTVPKKTRLAGRFLHELSCQPADNAETKYILNTRASDALKPRVSTTLVNDARAIGLKNLSGPGLLANDKFANFIKSTKDVTKKGKKQKPERAARMEQHKLRDALFALYDQHQYATMKAIKQRLDQPEVWLRENLEEIAVLHKSGRFNNHWELKSEYKRASFQGAIEAAPEVASEGEDSGSDEEDENVEMEDVLQG